jgi:hypothetical protein
MHEVLTADWSQEESIINLQKLIVHFLSLQEPLYAMA